MSELVPDYFEYDAYPFADTFPVGEHSVSYITRMRELTPPGERPDKRLLAGDVLRRTCLAGEGLCSLTCQAPEGYINSKKECSDQNLKEAVERLDIAPSDLLMVGVTADNVGFYDELRHHDSVTTNSVGIRELKGYNAFFARASEHVVLGARLADCGFAAIEFQDREGEDVIGFAHLTRPNLQGESALRFEVDGRPAGSFEYFLDKARHNYGADLDSVKVRVTAAIEGENYRHIFNKGKGSEDLFPGWASQGLLKNLTAPNWQPGDSFNPNDEWEPRYREMVRWQILRSGIDEAQLQMEHAIDPAQLELGHASNRAGKHGAMPDGRDAYLVRSLTHSPAE